MLSRGYILPIRRVDGTAGHYGAPTRFAGRAPLILDRGTDSRPPDLPISVEFIGNPPAKAQAPGGGRGQACAPGPGRAPMLP